MKKEFICCIKILIILSALVVISAPLRAQLIDNYGLKLGTTTSWFQDNRSETNTGESFGIFFDKTVYKFGNGNSNILITSFEFSVVERGGFIRDVIVQYHGGYSLYDFIVTNQRYLDIPLLLKYRIMKGEAFRFTPYTGYCFTLQTFTEKFNRKSKQSIEIPDPDARIIRYFDYNKGRILHGINTGVELAYKRFIADLRYYHGMNSIESLSGYREFDNKFSSISASLGIYLGKN
ncbi:outer membrane beta-barrel protein [candidate division KSB1 bacterium]